MKHSVGLILVVVLGIWGCSMFRSWTAIPPPGGCDQCHTIPISYDWQLAYKPVTLNDETGRLAWQRPESVNPPETSRVEERKLTEQRCFRCHKGPDKAHTDYQGRYHH